jgi:hypothetical protein
MPSPSMLIKEVKRMTGEAQPQISQIHVRLVNIGMMLARIEIDARIAKALDELKGIAFLPRKLADGSAELIKITAEYAIADHQRYGEALAGHDILLDFRTDEVQILHRLFQYLGITDRYISTTVTEVSTINGDSIEDEDLSQQLRTKAYALYW